VLTSTIPARTAGTASQSRQLSSISERPEPVTLN
jgi:hypothetical protein